MASWVDDLGGVLKSAASGAGSALDAATDVIIDKDAWSNTAQAILDGAGGKEVSGSDLVNMLLDSTMLIPGAGLAGGAARIGARTAGKLAAKETAEQAAKKTAATALRSPLNNAARGKVDDAATLLRGKFATATGKSVGKRMGAKDPLNSQLGRMAAKQNAGVGRKVGLGQTKKRVLANTAVAGGANLATRAYDEGLYQSLFGGDEAEGGSGVDSGSTVGGAPPQAGQMFIIGSDGSQQAVPKGFADALAEFMRQNGTVNGQQVTYLE